MSEQASTTPPMPLPRCILLTGYMGAGKSTVGRQLARQLGYRFIDTDRELVKRFNKSITRIFKEDGEQAFRQAEWDLLSEFLDSPTRWVISTGGGTLATQERIDLAKRLGTLVYLEADVGLLFERVIFSPKDRPMIDVPDAEAVFRQRFAQREPFYLQAEITVHSDQQKPHNVVNAILEALPSVNSLEG